MLLLLVLLGMVLWVVSWTAMLSQNLLCQHLLYRDPSYALPVLEVLLSPHHHYTALAMGYEMNTWIVHVLFSAGTLPNGEREAFQGRRAVPAATSHE